jgi:nucleoside-diphosphate-sugar epimerase
MRIVVTGAAGFIGSHLAEALALAGHDVLGVDAFTDYYDLALKQRNAAAVRASGARLVELDLAEGDLAASLDGAEVVFHLAAQPGLSVTTSLSRYVRNNLVATERLVEACLAQGSPPQLVYISTSSVYGAVATGDEQVLPRPDSHYGITKLAAEHLVMAACRDRGLPACSLRIFSVYGPRERPEKLFPLLIRSIVQRRPFPLFEGALAHRRSFTYVGDIVDGCIAALSRRDQVTGEVINLGTEATFTTAEGIRLIEEIMGRPADLARVPPRPGDQLTTGAVIGKARRLLGYAPTSPLRQGLEAEVAWFA